MKKTLKNYWSGYQVKADSHRFKIKSFLIAGVIIMVMPYLFSLGNTPAHWIEYLFSCIGGGVMIFIAAMDAVTNEPDDQPA